MPLTADSWPITAATLQFPATTGGGVSMQDAEPEAWAEVFADVREAGFDNIDVFDSWLRLGDLTPARLDEYAATARAAGIGSPSISAVRRSVIDAKNGEQNLAYSHRTIDAAAHLGMKVVSLGLHQPLTPSQAQQLWFWTVEGHRDPDDVEVWALAVRRLQELGRHAAEVGLVISLEMYEDTYLGSADSSVRLVEDIGLPSVGLNPDLGNLVRLHRPIESWREALEKTLPYANYWHVKNYQRDEDVAAGWFTAVPAPMQFGIIDYRWAFRTAIAAGFQGIVCTEHYGGDGLSVSATNQQYLRQRVLPKNADYSPGTSRVTQIRL